MYLEWFSFRIMCGNWWGRVDEQQCWLFPKMLSCQQAECRTERNLTGCTTYVLYDCDLNKIHPWRKPKQTREKERITETTHTIVNPRPAGVWLVTRPAGGGGAKGPLRSPKLLDRFPNFKRHSIALYVNYPYKVKNLTQMSLMTSQVRSKSEFSTFRAWWHRRVKSRC